MTAGAAAGIVAVDPARFGLSTIPIVLHAISFRLPTAIALGTAGLAALLLGPRSRVRTGSGWLSALGGVLVAGGVAQAGVLGRRGFAGRPEPGRADLVVVSLNTLGGAATPEQVAALVVGELAGADAAMVALPETPGELARDIADLLAAQGHSFQIFSTTSGPRPLDTTSLLVSAELGSYAQVPAPVLLLGAAMAAPVDGRGPTLAAVHPGAPTARVGYRTWRSDVDKAVGIARRTADSIVAGDFNATVDHAMLRHLAPCADAATLAGRGAEGTWPAHFPAALAAPIDHVLVNGDFRVLGTRAVQVGASDHRAVIVRLLLPAT